MAGFSSIADLQAQHEAGKHITSLFQKLPSAVETGGVWHSLWNVGALPAAGGNPATTPGEAYANAGIYFKNTSPANKHLLNWVVYAVGQGPAAYGLMMLYDRLVGVGGLSLATTGDKTVSSAALTRYTDGIGVQCWLEVSTATTTTAPIVTLNSYTDADGNSGQTGTALTFPAAATNLDVLVQLPLAADLGVRAVSTLNVGTAAAAGVCNLLLIKPLAYIPLAGTSLTARQFILQSLPPAQILDNASLGLAICMGSASFPTSFNGSVEVVYN